MRDPAAALGAVVVALVRLSTAHARPVAAALLALTVAAGWFSGARFALDSDVTKLFPQDLSWRVAELRLERAFPERVDAIAVVLDGPTAAATEAAAEALAGALRARGPIFRSVRRPDAGAFWDRHGLLYLETREARAVLERLVDAQPLLGTVAADPSLRGAAELARLVAEGIARGERAEAARPALTAMAGAAEAALAGRVEPPDWQRLLTGRESGALELRRFVLVRPALDHAQLSAGANATEAIRAEAARLDLDAAHGVTVRLTGQIPMADEEFATVAQGAWEGTILSFLGVGILLWMALRSWRLIWPLLVLIVAGLAWTAALGLLAFGSFNPLSIAFAVLFIGLGVDFGIQYSVQYRAERAAAGATLPALRMAARVAGPGMTLAALAVTGTFLALWPTDYRGVAELGAVAGMGMVVGWALAMTLLPALMVLARPRAEAREVGYPALAPLDAWLSRRASLVGWLAAGLALLCALAVSQLRFDTNPINLRDPGAESVATWRDLARNPDTNPYTLDALAPDLDSARKLAERLAALPEVGRATSLASFLPADQAEKLALVQDAAMLLGPGFLAERRAPPSDAEAVAALRRAAAALAPTGDAEAQRLARAFAAAAGAPPEARDRLARALLPGLADQLRRVEALLSAEEVTPEALPADLRDDWVAADGRHRVEAVPAVASDDPTTLRRFARAVQAVAPDATGLAVSSVGSSATIQKAFLESGLIALAFVLLLLVAALRSLRLALLALAPLALAGLMTLAHCALFGPDLNLANIIALPLLFGQGVAYDIYFVAAWKAGRRDLLASPLNRAVIYSAVTNAAAFGALALSPHPGTASMGVVLSLSLLYSLACVMLVLPPLLRLFAPKP